ncbi:MAG: hypothetical protein ABIT96_12350, partial [Ferruginibacter sp.]
MKRIFYLLLCLTLISACGHSTSTPASNHDSTNIIFTPPPPDTIKSQPDTVLKITRNILSQAGDSIIYEGNLESLKSSDSIPIKITHTGNLQGNIVTGDGNGGKNIRFTRIILPDRESDGPFGTSISYNIKNTGKYTFIIGHSLMA